MKKALKVSLIIVTAILVLVIAGALIAPFFITDTLDRALRDEFDRQTSQEYSLDFSDLNISLLGRSVSVDSILIEAGSDSPLIRKVEATSVSMNGIKWLSLLDGSLPHFNSITIINPDVVLLERPFSASSFSKDSEADTDTSQVTDIAEFDLSIQNGTGKIVRKDSTEIVVANGLNLEAANVNLNVLLNGSDLLFVEKLKIDGAGLKWSLKEQLYEITTRNFSFDKNAELLTISNIALTPLLPKYDFAKARGKQLDRIHLEIPEVRISGMQLDSLMSEQLELDTLAINNAWLEVFRDKHMERAPFVENEPAKPMLHEAARAIGFSLELNTTLVSNATIIYEEHNPPSDSSGSISFDNLYATIGPFRSAKHPRFYDDTLHLDVETLFMNAGSLKVDIRYPYFKDNNSHSVKASLGSMDPNEVRGMLENVGFLRIESGMVESLEAEYELNNDSSSGTVTVLYHDLKVSLLNKKNPEKKGIKQWAGDLIANTFMIKSNNTGDDPRVGEIDFEREKEKSIFAYWWKSLLSGLKDSMR